jgi:hypothetical protein
VSLQLLHKSLAKNCVLPGNRATAGQQKKWGLHESDYRFAYRRPGEHEHSGEAGKNMNERCLAIVIPFQPQEKQGVMGPFPAARTALL